MKLFSKRNKKIKEFRFGVYVIFVIIPLIAILSSGCGCSVRASQITTNFDEINPSTIATACINNLVHGQSGIKISNNSSVPIEYVNDFKGYMKDSNIKSLDLFESQVNDSISEYKVPGNIKDRFANDNVLLYSRIEDISIYFNDNVYTNPSRNPVCPNINKFDNSNNDKSPIPTIPPTNGSGVPTSPKLKYDGIKYKYSTQGRLGFLAFGGIINSKNGVDSWYVANPSGVCPKDSSDSNYYNVDINSVPENEINNLQQGYLYLKIGINSNNPKNTITTDADSFILLKYDINSPLFYQNTFQKSKNNWDSASTPNGKYLGNQRIANDLNNLQKIENGLFYANNDLENNLFLFDSFLGWYK